MLLTCTVNCSGRNKTPYEEHEFRYLLISYFMLSLSLNNILFCQVYINYMFIHCLLIDVELIFAVDDYILMFVIFQCLWNMRSKQLTIFFDCRIIVEELCKYIPFYSAKICMFIYYVLGILFWELISIYDIKPLWFEVSSSFWVVIYEKI